MRRKKKKTKRRRHDCTGIEEGARQLLMHEFYPYMFEVNSVV